MRKIINFKNDKLSDELSEFISEPKFHVTEEHWLSLSAAARYTGISVRKLTDLSNQGVIPCYNVLNRRAYKREDLDRYMQSVKWVKHPTKNLEPQA